MKCWICGKKATTSERLYRLEHTHRYLSQFDYEDIINAGIKETERGYCDSCIELEIERKEKELKEYINLNASLRFERAIKCLEKQNISPYEYQEEIKTIKEFMQENPDRFDSTEEVVSAIMLLYNEVKMKTQHKIDKYRVDFYLPEHKIIYEVDGITHKNTVHFDNKRDEKIRDILGKEWEIVRISTEHIRQNAELLWEAILAVKEEKQKVRKMNYGLLPEWYTKREKKET